MSIEPKRIPEPPGKVVAPNFELGDEHNRLLDEITGNVRSRFAHDTMQRDRNRCWPADGFSRLAKMYVAIETVCGLVYRALAKAKAKAVGARERGRGEIHKPSAAAFM